MTKKINQLDVEGFEAYTPNCQFDLESPDFVSAAAKFDLDRLDALLSVKLDCITQSFWSPKNARDGVLQTEGNFLTSLCARKEGFSRQRCGALTRKGTTRLCNLLPSKRRCKFHGGASTGPRTSEGRKHIAEAQRQRCAAWRKAKMLNQ